MRKTKIYSFPGWQEIERLVEEAQEWNYKEITIEYTVEVYEEDPYPCFWGRDDYTSIYAKTLTDFKKICKRSVPRGFKIEFVDVTERY